jgi:ferrous iron transport protein A
MRKLSELKSGEEGVIVSINYKNPIYHRLIEMGMLPGTKVRVMECAPLGDPVKYQLRGYCLSIRKEDSRDIYVKPFRSKKLVPLLMLSIGNSGKVETLEVDMPNRDLLKTYGICVGTTLKIVRVSRNLITVKVKGRNIGLVKSVCSKIIVVRT